MNIMKTIVKSLKKALWVYGVYLYKENSKIIVEN